MKTFEEYLKDIHAEDYKGLDDDMADNFNQWVADMDINECIEHAENYGQYCYQHAKDKSKLICHQQIEEVKEI